MSALVGLLGRAFAFFIAYAPPRLRTGMASAMTFLWFDVFRIRRDVALKNLELAFPNLSPEKRLQMARQSIFHLTLTIVEFSIFPFFSREKLDKYFEVQGLEHVQDALAQGRGVLFLGLHLSNGDFAIAAASALGLPINLISKQIKTRWLNDLWFGMRAEQGTKFIPVEKSSFDILRALNRGEIVIFVLDQFMGPPIGVRTKFFGHETGTAMGLALVHLRTKAPLIATYSYRKPDGKYVMVFEKEMVPAELDSGLDHRSETIAVLTQKYTDKIEEIVRRYPDQWMWIHRRWKDFVDAPKN